MTHSSFIMPIGTLVGINKPTKESIKMSRAKVSIMDLRASANEMTLRINKLGGVRVIKNDLAMLKYHRERLLDNPDLMGNCHLIGLVADYDNQILAKRWTLSECKELEIERDAVYLKQYMIGF